jgi:hypothetical protein
MSPRSFGQSSYMTTSSEPEAALEWNRFHEGEMLIRYDNPPICSELDFPASRSRNFPLHPSERHARIERRIERHGAVVIGTCDTVIPLSPKVIRSCLNIGLAPLQS